MTLRSKKFERAARRLVRGEIRASENLRAEFRRMKRGRWRRLAIPAWFGRLTFLIFLSLQIFQGRSITFLTALLVAWSVAAFFLRASQLSMTLHASPNLYIFQFLPISDADIFSIQFQRFLRTSLWTILDFAVLYYALIAHSGMGMSALLVSAILGVIQWLFIVAGATFLLAFGPMRFVPLLSWLLGAATLAFIFFGSQQLRISKWLVGAAYWVPPIGWILHSLGISPEASFAHALTPAVLSAMLLCLGPLAYRTVRQTYAVGEVTNASGPLPDRMEDSGTAAADRMPDGVQFPEKFAWESAGFVERLVSRILNPQEKSIVEFLTAANPGWTKSLRNFAILWMVILLGASFFAAQLRAQKGVAMYPVIFCAYILFAHLAGRWPGLACPAGVGLQSPLFAHYPIGFWDLARTMLKVNLARIGFYLGLMVLGISGGLLIGDFASLGSVILRNAPKIIILLLCLQPLMVVALISPATNDTKKSSFAVVAVIGILLLLGSGLTFFFAQKPMNIVFSGASVAVLSVGTLAVYGKMFNSGKFDLVPLAKNETAPQ